MLAQSFKTPEDLGLRDIEFNSLVTVLGMLEREELEFFDHDKRVFHELTKCVPTPKFFSMAYWSALTSCGSVCCIGGTAEVIGRFKFSDETPELFRLLYGPFGALSHEITPAQAAVALRNYLTYGEPRWGEALSC